MELHRRQVASTGSRRAQLRDQPETRTDSRNPWYVGFMFLFLLIWGVMLWVMWPAVEIYRLLTPLNLVLIALASYRIGRITSYDDVTQPLRLPFVHVYEEDGVRWEEPRTGGWRGAVAALITCPDAVGYWAAAFLIYFNLLLPEPAFVITLILAVNGLGQIFTALFMFLTGQRERPAG